MIISNLRERIFLSEFSKISILITIIEKKTKSKVQFHANVDIRLAIINAFKKQHHS